MVSRFACFSPSFPVAAPLLRSAALSLLLPAAPLVHMLSLPAQNLAIGLISIALSKSMGMRMADSIPPPDRKNGRNKDSIRNYKDIIRI